MSPNEGSRYMTIDGCAGYIGRTPEAIRQLVKRRQIPHFRIGRRVQFDRVKVDGWIERHARRGAMV